MIERAQKRAKNIHEAQYGKAEPVTVDLTTGNNEDEDTEDDK